MGRSCSFLVAVSLLVPAAGCQLTSPANLSLPPNTADTASHASTPLMANAGKPLPICEGSRKTSEVCVATAEALENAGREKEAQAEELEKAGKQKEALVLYAEKDGREKEAIALYEKARQNGSQKAVERRLAVLYDEQKDYNRALEMYKQLLGRNPKDADLLNDVGYCYYNQGNWAEAEKYLRQAVTINPKHPRACINLGMALAQNHKYPESLEAFTKVVSPAQAQCNLAFIWLTQGKREEAMAAYRQALAMEPNLGVARAALSRLERAGGAAAPVAIPQPLSAASPEHASREVVEAQTPIEVP